ncbi:hypothetical protein D9M68_824210 [compost metagenome]
MPQTMPTTSGEKPSCRMAGRSASCITAPANSPTNNTPLSLSRQGVAAGGAAGVVDVAGRGTAVLEELLMIGLVAYLNN